MDLLPPVEEAAVGCGCGPVARDGLARTYVIFIYNLYLVLISTVYIIITGVHHASNIEDRYQCHVGYHRVRGDNGERAGSRADQRDCSWAVARFGNGAA
jgi:hypothetical protein